MSRPPLRAKAPRALMCSHCAAGPDDGQARTLTAVGHHLVVTWHLLSCPQYAAEGLGPAGRLVTADRAQAARAARSGPVSGCSESRTRGASPHPVNEVAPSPVSPHLTRTAVQNRFRPASLRTAGSTTSGLRNGANPPWRRRSSSGHPVAPGPR